MRLKGGKFLVDCSDVNIETPSKTITFSDSELNAVITKGISILIKNLNEIPVCVDLIIKELQDGVILYNTIANDNGDTVGFSLSITSKTLTIYKQL